MAIFFIILLLLALGATIFLLVRAAKRLLQFDELFQRTWVVLSDYAIDLTDLTKGDLLLDNPEVIKFHKRNMNALAEISSIMGEITDTTSVKLKRREEKKLPAPDVV